MPQEHETDQLPVATVWSPMLFHVQVYLSNHPLVRGFQVSTTADGVGITAEMSYAGQTLRARQACPSWWEPRTPDHGRQLADQLARDLYAQWIESLRHH